MHSYSSTFLDPAGPSESVRARAWTNGDASFSSLIAFALAALAVGGFLITDENLNHWFLIPTLICGGLIGTDAIEWARGRLALYDPAGIVGLYGVNFFFLAPLLHVHWSHWMLGVAPPPDWRDWVGYMAILNAAGLIAYRLSRRFIARASPKPSRSFWEIDRNRFRLFAPFLLVISALLQASVYRRFGGIEGYVDAYRHGAGEFTGMGWIFMISESFPILAGFAAVLAARRRNPNWILIAIGLTILFGLQLLFGGLRGSRSQTVLMAFWLLGCVHLLVRSVPVKLVCLGSAFLFVFMYLYGFYKAVGTDATEAFASAEERKRLSQKTGRSFEAILLGDLARTDVQAFILYRLVYDGREFRYASGRTYVAALSLLIPKFFLPERPEGILQEGTEIQSGTGSYVPNISWSSRVYGLAGEAMLNFGVLSVPFVFAAFGLLVGAFRNMIAGLRAGDARFLLVPFGVFMCLSAVGADSDNVTFGLAKDGFMPALFVFLCSARRESIPAASTGPA